MASTQSTCRWQVAEPVPRYKTQPRKLKKTNKAIRVRWATVMTRHYPPLTSNPNTPWRKIPWINLKGYWLEHAGFTVGTPIRIEVKHQRITLIAKPET